MEALLKTTQKSRVLTTVEKVMGVNPGVFKRINEIKVPEILFHPIKTGSPEFDNSFSEIGGVTPGSAYLTTGPPGAGKTTILVTLGARLQTPKPVVFLSYEMSDFQLKLTAKKIPQLDQFMVVTEEFHKKGREEFEKFLNVVEELDPGMVIVDSLQKMASNMPGGNFNQNQIWLTEKLTAFAKRTFIPVNMIGHCSKDGVYKGPSTLLHEVDGQFKVFFDKETGERMFQFGKNRFGGVLDPHIFRINGEGVFIGDEYWSQPGNEDITEMAKKSIQELRKSSAAHETLPFKQFQETSKVVFKYLEHKHRDILDSRSNVKEGNIQLSFVGKRAWCNHKDGKINLGPGFFKSCSDTRYLGIGYAKEKPIMSKHVNNKVDAALWVIIHEFQHLFHGNSQHTKSFFERVANRWEQSTEVLLATE